MNHQPIAKIVSWNTYGEEVCASAARMSTTEGSALDIYNAALNNPHNANLIGKVLKSGHRSIMEHMVFSIALENVSVYAEQYFIEMRLASFTVKSRRYVNFGDQGYCIPQNLEWEDLESYKKHMNGLFETYRDLIALNIPKEDARFILPYSFCSNFYCTLNARELSGLIHSIRCGRGRISPELLDIARQLEQQAVEIFSAIAQEIPSEPLKEEIPDPPKPSFSRKHGVEFVKQPDIGKTSLLFGPKNQRHTLAMAYDILHPDMQTDPMWEDFVSSLRPRELEMLPYGFKISDITLAGLTHLTRHRMQSPVIPPIETVDLSRIVIPDSIAQNKDAWKVYQRGAAMAYEGSMELLQREALRPYIGYFALSGNLVNVATVMNARELKTFIQLRSCNRAQWEIRQVAISMLSQLRKHCPEIFDLYGPSCYLTGVCPEGKMCCGKTKETRTFFSAGSSLDKEAGR